MAGSKKGGPESICWIAEYKTFCYETAGQAVGGWVSIAGHEPLEFWGLGGGWGVYYIKFVRYYSTMGSGGWGVGVGGGRNPDPLSAQVRLPHEVVLNRSLRKDLASEF